MKNDLLQRAKDEVAQRWKYENWADFKEKCLLTTNDTTSYDEFYDAAMELYAKYRVEEVAQKAFAAGRNYQRGEYSEYHGGHEHDYPDFNEWIKTVNP